jgi:hypothetical protein
MSMYKFILIAPIILYIDTHTYVQTQIMWKCVSATSDAMFVKQLSPETILAPKMAHE